MRFIALTVMVLLSMTPLGAAQTPVRVALAMGKDEVKLSDLYDPSTGVYFSPVYTDPAAYTNPRRPPTDSGKSLIVAYLDTGVLHNHPLFKNVKIVDVDFTGQGVEDNNGHGTMTLLLYLGQTSFPDQTILNVRVLGKDGSGSISNIEKGMQWAADHGAILLNMALGVPQIVAQDLCDFTDKLVAERGVLVIAAAGNDPKIPMCPAAAKSVISVGADGMQAPMKPSLYAPGTITFQPAADDARSPATGAGATLAQFISQYLKAYRGSNLFATATIAKSNPAMAKRMIEMLLTASRRSSEHGDCDGAKSNAAVIYRLSSEIGDSEHEATSLNEFGVGLQCAGEFKTALGIYQSAIQLHRLAKDPFGEEVTLSNIGELQEQMGQHAEAKQTLEASLKMARDPRIKDEEGEVTTLGNLCTVYYSLHQLSEAIRHCNLALSLAHSEKRVFLEGRNYLNLGIIYADSANPVGARDSLEKAEQIFLGDGDQEGLSAARQKLAALMN